jgi:hypothetical protein
MSTTANSKPARPPVIRHTPTATGTSAGDFLRLLPAAIISAVVHVALFGLLFLVASPSDANTTEKVEQEENKVKEDDTAKKEDDQPPIATNDVDEAAKDADVEINYDNARKAEVSVPGEMKANDPVGIEGAKDNPLTSIAAPSGVNSGQGGSVASMDGTGEGVAIGQLGGYNGVGKPTPGSFYGRSGATKKRALREGGGTTASEAAVAKGLEWIIRHQAPDGHWSIDGFNQTARCNCENRGSHNNDIAGTAFGLLPLLGAGHTHKADKKNPNPYQKNVLAALKYLMRKQNRNGDFGGGMYSHGLAAIAMCEAYALTQDPNLKRSAQAAIKYIVFAQHNEGGWRYGPKQKGDTSVVGWQVMALKSAQMANLDVPARTMKKAQDYLDSCMSDTDYGYGYFEKGSTPTMSAVGLLCRQYIQGWGPSSPRMSKGVANWLMKYIPTSGKNMYYYYYATQVLHHFGGESWDKWNVAMRDALIREQDQGLTPRHAHAKGSWSPVGDLHGDVGGRLMITSLSILTLEVYYRHLPLYRRITDDDLKVKKEDMKEMKKEPMKTK